MPVPSQRLHALCPGAVELRAADGALYRLHRGHGERRRRVVPVRAAVAGAARKQQPQAVQQLRPGAEGAAYARHARTLPQRERRGDVQHVVHLRPLGLGHSPARVGGKRLKIAARALGIQHAEGERALPAAGHPGDRHNLAERHVHVHVFQVVDSRAAYLHMVAHKNISQSPFVPRRDVPGGVLRVIIPLPRPARHIFAHKSSPAQIGRRRRPQHGRLDENQPRGNPGLVLSSGLAAAYSSSFSSSPSELSSPAGSTPSNSSVSPQFGHSMAPRSSTSSSMVMVLPQAGQVTS